MASRGPTLRTGSISFSEYPIEEVCRKVHAAGFDGLEIWRPQLARCRTPELLGLFSEYATGIGVQLCALNDVNNDYYRPFESEYAFSLSLEGLKNSVDIARALGVPDVLAWEGMRPKVWTRDPGELLRITTDLYRQAIMHSARFGIQFLIEPHPFTLGMDLDFLKGLCDSLDRRYFGILYDSCHFGVGRPKDYADCVRVLGKRIKHVHFADSDQVTSELHFPLGRGRLDIDGIVDALAETGYSGTISLDTFGYPLPEEAAAVGLPVLKKTVERLGLR